MDHFGDGAVVGVARVPAPSRRGQAGGHHQAGLGRVVEGRVEGGFGGGREGVGRRRERLAVQQRLRRRARRGAGAGAGEAQPVLQVAEVAVGGQGGRGEDGRLRGAEEVLGQDGARLDGGGRHRQVADAADPGGGGPRAGAGPTAGLPPGAPELDPAHDARSVFRAGEEAAAQGGLRMFDPVRRAPQVEQAALQLGVHFLLPLQAVVKRRQLPPRVRQRRQRPVQRLGHRRIGCGLQRLRTAPRRPQPQRTPPRALLGPRLHEAEELGEGLAQLLDLAPGSAEAGGQLLGLSRPDGRADRRLDRGQHALALAVETGDGAEEPGARGLGAQAVGGGLLQVVGLVEDDAPVGGQDRRVAEVVGGDPHRQV